MCKHSDRRRCREGMGPNGENAQRGARHKNTLRNHINNNANRMPNRDRENSFPNSNQGHKSINSSPASSRLRVVNMNGNTERRGSSTRTSPIPIVNSTPPKTVSPFSASPPRSPAVPNVYSGSKFHDPPSPQVLPRPPTHWFENNENAGVGNCAKLTSVLKVMLKVQA